MKSWLSMIMAFILWLTLTFNDVIKAQEAKLIGTVYCDTCFHQYFSLSSHFISGALVAVECGGDEIQASGGKPRFREEVKTNVKGEFRVILPFSPTKHVNEIKRCSVRLISSSEPDCAVAAISTSTSSSIQLKMKTLKKHVFTSGFFTFQPLEQPKRCQWESHVNSNDKILASTPLPSPVVDGMLAPIPPLTDWNQEIDQSLDFTYENNLRSLDPISQIIPPLLVPSFPFQPPPHSIFIPMVPPPPDFMLNPGLQPPSDSMLGFQPPPASMLGFHPPPNSMLGFHPPPNSMLGFHPPPNSMLGFQPPPDSMLGFQPPPDSMLGFQPPPDSMLDIGFQPPPDSMFNPNPLQPPNDSIVDPSESSPPTLNPQLLTPPPPPPPPSLSPSLSPPPLDDQQPDLTEATPPPPFNPPFPAFPFQPSAGLPRMPPGTTNPPSLYK
ncbi:uncharacterized protein LOC143566092 [Bidens hawaiensis]|uniref:uncharacterized protein LOC143566092 n=1 Tax=Bidens hawaiensis TaxID=980011 RepID=UPI00404A3D46